MTRGGSMNQVAKSAQRIVPQTTQPVHMFLWLLLNKLQKTNTVLVSEQQPPPLRLVLFSAAKNKNRMEEAA